jgi:hypothetical protein
MSDQYGLPPQPPASTGPLGDYLAEKRIERGEQAPPPGWAPPQQQPRPPAQYPPQPPPGYYQQAPPPRRRRSPVKTFFAVIGGLVTAIVIIVVVVVAVAAGKGAGSGAGAGVAAKAGGTVTYEVTGSPAQVTYGPAGSSLNGRVPMRLTKPIGSPDFYSIDAQLNGRGIVTCELLVDGKVVSRATATGAYNIASCEITQDFSGNWQNANSN